ncbi:ROK family protein [Amnibacterium flavum]|uniref:ROK family protein n=1 Tax=Amnibacterium flavum TaxID=2173173 RepID=A0A2V1HP39_9MICO|nr:ROK family protein [Amnibacterium flavum]PVZ93372.1 ROK family protein [Amnibacterium flavum]
MGDADRIPVLEIGGTHLTTALVEPADWTVSPGSLTRSPIHPKADLDDLLGEIAGAATALTAAHAEHRPAWAVAIPGPFDYVAGVGRYENVDKFESLTGQDVRGGLMTRIVPTPAMLHFINDADAYGLGEAIIGAARGYSRSICLTLGTGVGSAFIVDGVPVQEGPGVAPEGSIHLIDYNGQPLEDTMSRRALLAAYARATGVTESPIDVREIFELARTGDPIAMATVEAGLSGLGRAIASTVSRFAAEILVLGGSMTGSWDLVEPLVRAGLVSVDPGLAGLPIERAQHPEDAPLVGAAFWAAR